MTISRVKKTLALNPDGEITCCYAPKEKRGILCNHIIHQTRDEERFDFLKRAADKVNETNTNNKSVADVLINNDNEYSISLDEISHNKKQTLGGLLGGGR